MFQTFFCSFRSSAQMIAILFFMATCAVVIRAQEQPAHPVLDFEGNKVFTKQELLETANRCLTANSKGQYGEVLEYCLHRVTTSMRSRGYLQAKLNGPRTESEESGSRMIVPVEEGPLYRVGDLRIEGAKLFPTAQLAVIIGLQSGDIANGEALGKAVYERIKDLYATFGYIQYTAEIVPTFHVKDGASEGVVDLIITVEEGQQFTVQSIKFMGADKATIDFLRKELLVREGDIYNFALFRDSITRMNATGLMAPIDAARDVDFHWDQKTPRFDLTIKLKKIAAATNVR